MILMLRTYLIFGILLLPSKFPSFKAFLLISAAAKFACVLSFDVNNSSDKFVQY